MNLKEAVEHPAAFREQLRIDVDGVPRRLVDVIQPWQAEDFIALDTAWLSLSGRGADDLKVSVRRLWSERPRGCSKTGDVAAMVVWILLAAVREVSGVAVASDSDQAKLMVEAIGSLIRLNGLSELFDVLAGKVVNRHTGSSLTVVSSDAGSSYGVNPHFVLCDELTHWADGRGSLMWDSIASSAAKRPSCVFVCILNAGWRDSWVWPIREAVRTDARWRFSRVDGSAATWISANTLEEQRRLLPPKSYLRLWENVWSDQSGDAISREAVEACAVLSGPSNGTPAEYRAFGALDLGIKKDRSALAVLGVHHRTGESRLLTCRSWSPQDHGGEVDLPQIETEVADVYRQFRLSYLMVDPWNAAYMLQNLKARGCRVTEFPFAPANVDAMARELMGAFRNREVAIYRDEELIADLCSMNLMERPDGRFKLIAKRDERGHADKGFSVAMCLARRKLFIEDAGSRYRSPPQGFSSRHDANHARPMMPAVPRFFC